MPATPVIDPARFRKTLGSYPTGVAAVTAATAQGPVGMCVGTFTSISLDPPLVGFFPQLASRTLPELVGAGHFCVNVLGVDQEHLARRFAGPTQERFTGLELTTGPTGAPRLVEALLWIDCTLEQVHEIGDHALVVGRVHDLGTARQGIDPLVFHHGSYAALAAR